VVIISAQLVRSPPGKAIGAWGFLPETAFAAAALASTDDRELRVIARDDLAREVADLETAGAAAFIAGSRTGIDFAGAVAKATALPVLAVPILVGELGSVEDFLEPFRSLPTGLATFAIGRPGAINAALFAATIVSERTSPVWKMLRTMRDEQVERVRAMKI
jgi:5-(carboxyamino)imidazole ribonucleotide mutase